MARVEKRETRLTRVQPHWLLLGVGGLELVAGLYQVGYILLHLYRYGLAWMETFPGGPLLVWFTFITWYFLPGGFLIWLAILTLRMRRLAWPLQVALGIAGCAYYGAGLPLLLAMAPRSVRWRLGIGPDALLAEIEARGQVSLVALAASQGVTPAVARAALEQAIAAGQFAGAFDRAEGQVYSAGTVATQAELQRCPHCGGGLAVVGQLAHCPYCETELARQQGLDYPMPLPVGLEILRALDGLLAYAWVFFGGLTLVVVQALPYDELPPADAFREKLGISLLFGGVPILLGFLSYLAGRWLRQGRRRGWMLQACLLPPTLPYLLRRRVRAVCGLGLGRLQEAFAQAQTLSFEALAGLLKMPVAAAQDMAVYLVATGVLPGVLDWHEKRVVSRGLLRHDGREHCDYCGSPRPLGGRCRYCGSGLSREEAR